MKAEVVFYQYPDIAYCACTGVTVTTDKKGTVWGYQRKDERMIRKRTFEALCDEVKNVEDVLPERFGQKLDKIKHKGVILKPSGLIAIKPISPLAASTETLSFQFKKGCISSFTRALENAEKTKSLIYDYQLGMRSLRTELHEVKKLINE